MQSKQKEAIVIGAGIMGLAMARSLSERGYSVSVFERNQKAVGASIRNFGMIWPIGQPNGALYERALRSKSIWKQVCSEAHLWYAESGSLHLAYNDGEVQVLQEFIQQSPGRPLSFLSPVQAVQKSEGVNPFRLKGALWSADELIVESRLAIEKLPAYLHEKYGVVFHFGTAVTGVDHPFVYSGKKRWAADEIYVCSGADFETLYPDVFAAAPFTKCKLQMMRLVAQPGNWRIGPALCGGLSLVHYKSFASAPSLPLLYAHYQNTLPDYLKWGIHVMVSQNGEGELTIGDSHEYGLTHDPFNKQFINDMIIDYLKSFASFKDWRLLQSWHGIYPKMLNNTTEYVVQPQPGVTLVNGLGGAGMTLSFGLAEEIVTGAIKATSLLHLSFNIETTRT